LISKLQKEAVGPVADLCSKGFDHKTGEFITYKAGGVTFQIIRATGQNQDVCKTVFTNIISQCIVAQNVDGGEAKDANGAIYSVYHESLEHEDLKELYLEKRSARNLYENDDDDDDDFGDLMEIVGRGKLNARRKTKTKPKTKLITKPTPTPKPTPKLKTTRSKTETHSATSSSTTANPTKACKAIYAEAMKEIKAEVLEIEKTSIEKRTTPKIGTSCGDAFNALAYPQVNDMVCNFLGQFIHVFHQMLVTLANPSLCL
jgi:hypothetical protein